MVERCLAKADIAGSNPVSRSKSSAPWPSGKAKVCKTYIPSSILGGASTFFCADVAESADARDLKSLEG